MKDKVSENTAIDSKICVAEHSAVICDKVADYKFLRGGENCFISVCFDGESTELLISRDFFTAVKFYQLIVENLVTPCTLGDIFEDFLAENS
ncbi:MAG: hypothetical protein IKT56_00900 [Clostridia bacterium]|nr:hypothetical protein [Clostridia bacterium]